MKTKFLSAMILSVLSASAMATNDYGSTPKDVQFISEFESLPTCTVTVDNNESIDVIDETTVSGDLGSMSLAKINITSNYAPGQTTLGHKIELDQNMFGRSGVSDARWYVKETPNASVYGDEVVNGGGNFTGRLTPTKKIAYLYYYDANNKKGGTVSLSMMPVLETATLADLPAGTHSFGGTVKVTCGTSPNARG